MFFEDHIDDAKYCGHLYGLGAAYIQNGSGAGGNSGSGAAVTNNYETHASTVANGDVTPASSSSTSAAAAVPTTTTAS